VASLSTSVSHEACFCNMRQQIISLLQQRRLNNQRSEEVVLVCHIKQCIIRENKADEKKNGRLLFFFLSLSTRFLSVCVCLLVGCRGRRRHGDDSAHPLLYLSFPPPHSSGARGQQETFVCAFVYVDIGDTLLHNDSRRCKRSDLRLFFAISSS
jgi:hypothetical protein